MKTEEKNTKRFWRRGNVLDIAIVLLLLAAVVTVAYRYYQTKNATEDAAMSTVTLTYRVEQASTAIPALISADETLYLDSRGDALGTILVHPQATNGTPLLVTASKVTLRDEEGNYIVSELPDATMVDFEGRVRCRGTLENGTFLLDGRTPITPGQTIVVHTEQTTFTLTVMVIDLAPAD